MRNSQSLHTASAQQDLDLALKSDGRNLSSDSIKAGVRIMPSSLLDDMWCAHGAQKWRAATGRVSAFFANAGNQHDEWFSAFEGQLQILISGTL